MPRSLKLSYCELLQHVQMTSFQEIAVSSQSISKTSHYYLLYQTLHDFYRKNPPMKTKKAEEKPAKISDDFSRFEKATQASETPIPITEEPLNEDMKVWLHTLLQWCEDVDNEVVNASLRALQHFTTNSHCAHYLADHSSNLILRLFEETDNNPTLERKRALSSLIESISSVGPTEELRYCFDRCEEFMATELKTIGEDIIPVDVLQYTTEPHRWMQYIIHICFQHDLQVLYKTLNEW